MLLSDKIKSEFYPDKANVIKDQLITHWISEEANEPPAGLCENCCLPSGSSLGHQARFPHPSLPLQQLRKWNPHFLLLSDLAPAQGRMLARERCWRFEVFPAGRDL